MVTKPLFFVVLVAHGSCPKAHSVASLGTKEETLGNLSCDSGDLRRVMSLEI